MSWSTWYGTSLTQQSFLLRLYHLHLQLDLCINSVRVSHALDLSRNACSWASITGLPAEKNCGSFNSPMQRLSMWLAALVIHRPYPEGCAIAEGTLLKMRQEFEFWYPFDLRVSGRRCMCECLQPVQSIRTRSRCPGALDVGCFVRVYQRTSQFAS